ncbi:MAG: serine hydrolase [Chloroflexi bacterium]|nr:serine hydrolase [Chloroflexota bacterium]
MSGLARAAVLFAIIVFLMGLAGCERPSPPNQPTLSPQPIVAATPTLVPTSTAAPTATATPLPTAPPTATPFFAGAVSPACGQILPILAESVPLTETLDPDPEALAHLQAIIPEAARPALNRLLAAPGTVGLAAYRVGQQAEGAYLNANAPMPLASVVKVVHLVAYAEAVAAGQLDSTDAVTLAALETFYLPNLDLGAHQNAAAALAENGRLFGDPPSMLLDELPGMMIEYSSNAAADYLHMLLGQTAIEETAVALGLTNQTAPCPWLGQFLVMGNHTRTMESDRIAVQHYIDEPERYGRDVMLFTEAYSADPEFRQTAVEWRRENRRPNGQTQRFFSETLNAKGTANDYASLMARIAQNGLSDGESSFIARRELEWIMRFPANQTLFSNAGYKNGSLPGILTTVYYAYPLGETSPIVVALFFRDLNGRAYQQWRNNLTHDELARWLLSDPAAIPAMKAMIEN